MQSHCRGSNSRDNICLQANFEHENSLDPVTREQFMMTLVNLRSVQLRAGYQEDTRRSTLSDVMMEAASDDGFGEQAKNVEQCRCPPNYSGSSCERCASGYYRCARHSILVECAVFCRFVDIIHTDTVLVVGGL